MGLLDQIAANRITMNSMELWGPDGLIHRPDMQTGPEQNTEDAEYEIERGHLTLMLFDLVKNDVNVIFDDSITSLEEGQDGIRVDFRRGLLFQ